MSAVIQPDSAARMAPSLPLLAVEDLARVLVVHAGEAVSAGRFLAQAQALAARLPPRRHAVNLCSDRYRFLLSFCAVALAGQTNLLPAARTAQAVAGVIQAYPGSYVLSDCADQCGADGVLVPAGADLSASDSAAMPSIAAGHVVAIGFTSGSTGTPKPNAKTWGSVCASSALNAAALGVDRRSAGIVATVPPQHMYGLELSVLLPLRSHAAIHASQPFFPADIEQALAQVAAPRLLVTTPFHLRALAHDVVAPPALWSIVSATAPLDAEFAGSVEARFQTRIIELFGSTETCVIAQRRASRDEPWHLYPGITLHSQPDGTLVQAPHFAEPTLLQDIVELLPDNRFRLCGRNGDLLEIAGKRASLADLTQRLLAIDGVRDGVIFQLDPDVRGLRRLAALVVAPALDEAQIREDLRAAVDPVFLPRPLLLVDALPRNAAGKLPREALLAAVRSGNSDLNS